MVSYTKEEFAQKIAQLQDSGQNIGSCIMGEMRKDREDSDWKTKYEKEHKLRQEAETEVSLIKGINRNEAKELQKRIDGLLNRIEALEKDLGKRVVTG